MILFSHPCFSTLNFRLEFFSAVDEGGWAGLLGEDCWPASLPPFVMFIYVYIMNNNNEANLGFNTRGYGSVAAGVVSLECLAGNCPPDNLIL